MREVSWQELISHVDQEVRIEIVRIDLPGVRGPFRRPRHQVAHQRLALLVAQRILQRDRELLPCGVIVPGLGGARIALASASLTVALAPRGRLRGGRAPGA